MGNDRQIYLLTAIGLTHGGSSTVHTNNTQNRIQLIWEECWLWAMMENEES